MKIATIHSEAEYEVALAYVATLMDAAPDSPEEAELVCVAALVEAYEEVHYPIAPPHPIDALLFRLDQNKRQPTEGDASP